MFELIVDQQAFDMFKQSFTTIWQKPTDFKKIPTSREVHMNAKPKENYNQFE